jgi:uncharacterized protein involved in tolerance to divalent cations
MSEPQTVYILTRTIQDEMEIVAVFKTEAALEQRILSKVKANDLSWLTGLGMQKHTVMES